MSYGHKEGCSHPGYKCNCEEGDEMKLPKSLEQKRDELAEAYKYHDINSTGQCSRRGYREGFNVASELWQVECEALISTINNFIAEDMPYYPYATRKLVAKDAVARIKKFMGEK